MQDEYSSTRFNLEKSTILILDGDAMSMAIFSQILAGFGAKNLLKCADVAAAKTAIQRGTVDLVIVDPTLVEEGYDFLPWLRRHGPTNNKHCSALIATGHTQSTRVKAARDAGANMVVAKPISPTVLFERVMWMVRDKRPYVECKAYAGPDRRFKFAGPPPGSDGRRDGDLSGEVGAASEPNLSQADIDAMMAPRKVTL